MLALAVIYWHRRISFGGQIEKRLVSICAIISAATVASVGLQLAFFGGNPRFMAVRNLGSIGLVDIYGFVLAFVSYRVLFSLLKNKDGQVVAPALSVMKKGGGKK
ncbi:MAG: hypothetical protein FWE09_07430 [Treponema sp.]|nr:hypothetical protein [Treponema sp.]